MSGTGQRDARRGIEELAWFHTFESRECVGHQAKSGQRRTSAAGVKVTSPARKRWVHDLIMQLSPFRGDTRTES